MAAPISTLFPNLSTRPFQITSPATPGYNCIAWAAGDTTRWWWPDEDAYWPTRPPYLDHVDAFIAVFGDLGFALCDGDQLETDFEEIAFFGTPDVCKHTARQLADGRWTSKLGKLEDIEHDSLDGLVGVVYGNVICVMKRAVRTQSSSP